MGGRAPRQRRPRGRFGLRARGVWGRGVRARGVRRGRGVWDRGVRRGRGVWDRGVGGRGVRRLGAAAVRDGLQERGEGPGGRRGLAGAAQGLRLQQEQLWQAAGPLKDAIHVNHGAFDQGARLDERGQGERRRRPQAQARAAPRRLEVGRLGAPIHRAHHEALRPGPALAGVQGEAPGLGDAARALGGMGLLTAVFDAAGPQAHGRIGGLQQPAEPRPALAGLQGHAGAPAVKGQGRALAHLEGLEARGVAAVEHLRLVDLHQTVDPRAIVSDRPDAGRGHAALPADRGEVVLLHQQQDVTSAAAHGALQAHALARPRQQLGPGAVEKDAQASVLTALRRAEPQVAAAGRPAQGDDEVVEGHRPPQLDKAAPHVLYGDRRPGVEELRHRRGRRRGAAREAQRGDPSGQAQGGQAPSNAIEGAPAAHRGARGGTGRFGGAHEAWHRAAPGCEGGGDGADKQR